MTARQHVATVLKGIDDFKGQVFFVERPSDGSYPCAVYSTAGNRFIEELATPGAVYASWYTVEVRAASSGEAERLAETVLRAFRAGGRMEIRRDLSFLYDTADASVDAQGPYGVYRAMSGYLIREQG